MNGKSIDIKAALQFGWDTLKAHLTFFLKLLVVLIVASVIPAMILSKIGQAVGPMLGLPLQFLNIVWQAILGMGVLKICLKLYDRQPVDIPDLWSTVPQTLDYIVVKFLFGLIVTVGFILLIIPGLIWSIQFYMANYLVVDKQKGPIEALKGSSTLTQGIKWDLAGFAGVVVLINLIGFVFLGVGLFITIPLTMLASVYVYRKLLAQTEALGQ